MERTAEEAEETRVGSKSASNGIAVVKTDFMIFRYK